MVYNVALKCCRMLPGRLMFFYRGTLPKAKIEYIIYINGKLRVGNNLT